MAYTAGAITWSDVLHSQKGKNMRKQLVIEVLKSVQALYSEAIASHATFHNPTFQQQLLLDRLFAGYERVTSQLDALL